LICVGRELLRGEIADGNARIVAEAVARRGGTVRRITVVDDRVPEIASALREAFDRNPHLVATTGGLGPAPDDVTLIAVAEALGLPLTSHHQARTMVEAAYQLLHKSGAVASAGLNLAREKMCRLPVGSTALPNSSGIAPGVICRVTGGAAVLCLPGMPREMQSVLAEALTLLGELGPKVCFARRQVETPTADESSLRPMLERLSAEYDGVWISSRPVGPGTQGCRVLVTLEARAATPENANALVGRVVKRLLALASGSR
jgi:nicotinamide-nucleotide amidase